MESTDVVVIGGGPAGLAVAETVARSQLKVILLEQNSEIGSPIHTSGGSFIESLKALEIPSQFYHPLSKGRFLSPSREISRVFEPPVACALDVRATYQYLAIKAAQAGANIRVNATATAPLVEDEFVVGVKARDFRGKQTELRAKVVVDASGYKATLARKVGLHAGSNRFGVGAEYDLYAPHYDDQEAVLIVGSQIAPAGYAWALPWGNGRVRVGVGIIHADSRDNPSEYLEQLIKNGSQFRLDFDQAQPIEYHYGLIPSNGFYDRFVGNGIVAVGDAAGQASTLVGEGIRFSITAGRMAGEAITQAFERGDFSRQGLQGYERQWRSKYGLNLVIAYEVNKRIAKWDDKKWDQGAELLEALSPEQFAQAFQSNFVGWWLLSAMLHNPKIIAVGLEKIGKKLVPMLLGDD